MAKKKMVTTRHKEDLGFQINYSSLTNAIDLLQRIAERDDCDPNEANVELDYSRGYYDEIEPEFTVRWIHEREETDKEQQKRLATAAKARETRKRKKEQEKEKEIKERDRLLKKHPL